MRGELDQFTSTCFHADSMWDWLLKGIRVCQRWIYGDCTKCRANAGKPPPGRLLVLASCPIFQQPVIEGPLGMQPDGPPVQVGLNRKRFMLGRAELDGYEDVKVIAGAFDRKVWCAKYQDWRADHETCDSYEQVR
jgi:hypothetical protein